MSSWRESIATFWYRTPLYAATLPRRAPQELPTLPHSPWPGQPANADRLFQGRYVFAGVEVVSPRVPPWESGLATGGGIDGPSLAAWSAELHGFAWLADFAAQGGDMARRMARALVQSWLTHHRGLERSAWTAPVLGRRVASWLNAAHFLLDGAEDPFGHDLLLSLARQAVHLGRIAPRTEPSAARAEALLGLAYAAECFADGRQRWPDASREYAATLSALIAEDGGPASRNPSTLLHLLRDAAALQRFLLLCDPEAAKLLAPLLERMAPMLRFFRHGDGGLAVFHGGAEENAGVVEHTLQVLDRPGKPPSSATATGYERIAAKRSLLLLDVDGPPRGARAAVHCAPLAFEFSHGKDRLIVNCGTPRRRGGDWPMALARAAAHSTLSLDGLEAAETFAVIHQRREQDGHAWIEAEHTAFAGHGLTHGRRLYLASDGDDLRGEETLTGGAAARPIGFTLRFHLHPSVHASAVAGGDTVLVKAASGQGWRFRSQGGVLRLEESVYFGQEGTLRRAQQIVLAGSLDGSSAVLKWAFARVVPPPPRS